VTSATPRGVIALSVIASAIVVVQLARLSVYIVDPADARWSVIPWNAFTATHSCMSGYWAAGRAVETMPNVWDDSLSSTPGPTPTSRRVMKRIGPFFLDTYEYTPTFLLLPRALLHVTPDFFAFRQLWFVLNLATVLLAIGVVSRRLAAALGPSVLWLAPLILAPLAVLATFQIGNVQLACIAASLLAMLCFESAAAGRHATILYLAGGVLLAYMTVSKLYPGVLVFYLLVRRDWRAVEWTAACAIGFVLIGLADMGVAAHMAFLDHLPGLLSGEAFPNLRIPNGIAANMSVPGIALKLGWYGVPGMSFGAMRVVGWIYTVVLLGIVYRLGRRPVAARVEPIVWIVILLLATLRSPVLPVYGIFPVVWLVTILLAAHWTRPLVRASLLVLYVLLAGIAPGQTLWPPDVHAIFSTVVQTAGAVAIAVAVLRLARAPVPVASA
jgi:alpha-1,2-mannosyltransferase